MVLAESHEKLAKKSKQEMRAFLKGKADEFLALDEKGRLEAHMALVEQVCLWFHEYVAHFCAVQPEADYVKGALGPKIIKRTVGKNLLAGLVYTDASQLVFACVCVCFVCFRVCFVLFRPHLLV